MSKEEAKSEFLEDLRNKVPNKEVFAVATKPQIETIAKRVLPEIEQKVENFLKEEESYDFSMEEIPSDLWFEIVAFLVLTAERTDNPVSKKSDSVTVIQFGKCEILSWDNEVFLNLDDKKIQKKLEEIQEALNVMFYQISTDVTVEDLIAYAKSDRPDF